LRFALDISAVTVSHPKGSGVNSTTASDPRLTVYLVVSGARVAQASDFLPTRLDHHGPDCGRCADMLGRSFMPPPFQVAPSYRENADLFGRPRADPYQCVSPERPVSRQEWKFARCITVRLTNN